MSVVYTYIILIPIIFAFSKIINKLTTKGKFLIVLAVLLVFSIGSFIVTIYVMTMALCMLLIFGLIIYFINDTLLKNLELAKQNHYPTKNICILNFCVAHISMITFTATLIRFCLGFKPFVGLAIIIISLVYGICFRRMRICPECKSLNIKSNKEFCERTHFSTSTEAGYRDLIKINYYCCKCGASYYKTTSKIHFWWRDWNKYDW